MMSSLMSSYVYTKIGLFVVLFCVKKPWQREKRRKGRGKGLFWEGEVVFFDEILKDLTYIPPEGREKKA